MPVIISAWCLSMSWGEMHNVVVGWSTLEYTALWSDVVWVFECLYRLVTMDLGGFVPFCAATKTPWDNLVHSIVLSNNGNAYKLFIYILPLHIWRADISSFSIRDKVEEETERKKTTPAKNHKHNYDCNSNTACYQTERISTGRSCFSIVLNDLRNNRFNESAININPQRHLQKLVATLWNSPTEFTVQSSLLGIFAIAQRTCAIWINSRITSTTK